MRVTKSPTEGFPLPTDYDTSARWDSGFSPWGLLLKKHTHTHMNLPTALQHKRNKTAEVTTRGRQSKESDQIKANLFNSYSLDFCHDPISCLAFNMTHVKFKKWPQRKGIFLNAAFFVYPIHPSINQLPLLTLHLGGGGAVFSSCLQARGRVQPTSSLQG